MSNTSCRWGILSTALIGQKNWQAIKKSGNGIVTAVASRSLDSSQRFIDACQGECPFEVVPQALDSYESLLTRDDVDAIYIPLPTGMRKEWVIAAANAGKHVMCEKPCAASAHDLEEMIAACQENNVQFMDGVMYMHTNRLQQMRQALDSGRIGDIKRIHCQFSFCADDEWIQSNIRVNSDLEPQGCLGDLGWYCIRFALWSMNWQMPERVTATILHEVQRADSPGPVPLEFSAEMFFPNGISASFYCSFQTHHQQWANISGTKGYLHVTDYVLPYAGNELKFDISNAEFVCDGCDFHMDDHRETIVVNEGANSTEDAQETNLFRAFNELALSTPDNHWPETSLKTQLVMDACLKSARQDSEEISPLTTAAS